MNSKQKKFTTIEEGSRKVKRSGVKVVYLQQFYPSIEESQAHSQERMRKMKAVLRK